VLEAEEYRGRRRKAALIWRTPPQEYWLTQVQALKVVAKSETAKADATAGPRRTGSSPSVGAGPDVAARVRLRLR
jgi:hypothetical protein